MKLNSNQYNSRNLFQEYVMRESAHDSLRKLADDIKGNVMFFGTRALMIQENTIHQDSIECLAESREDAAKIMKFLRKKGILASRIGACGILIQK